MAPHKHPAEKEKLSGHISYQLEAGTSAQYYPNILGKFQKDSKKV